MLLKVVSSTAIDDPGELLDFKAGLAASHNLPIYVLIDDLEPRLIGLK